MRRRTTTLFSSADMCAFSSPTRVLLQRVDTMSMMPPGGVGRIDRKLIHRSAWKGNSPKFAALAHSSWSSLGRASRLPQQQHTHHNLPQRDYRGKDDRGDPGKPDGFSRVGLYQADQHRADTSDHNHPPQPSGVLTA